MKKKYARNREDSKRTVLIITPSLGPDIGGVESYLESLLPLIKGGVYIIAPKPVYAKDHKRYDSILESEYGARVVRSMPPLYTFLKKNFDYDWMHKLLFWYLMAYMRHDAVRLARRQDINLVHAQEYMGAMIASRLYERFNIPYICTVHSYNGVRKEHFFARMVYHSLKHAGEIFTSSNKIYHELRYFGLKKIMRYTQWVDTERFHPIQSRHKNQILIAGRVSREKGFDKIIQSLGKASDNGMHAIFIGEGYGLSGLKKRNKQLRFIGAVSNSEMNRHYNDAACTVMPTIVSGNIPRTAMESLAAGTPITFLDNSAASYPWLDGMIHARVVCTIGKTKSAPDIRRCRAYALKNFSSKNAASTLRHYR